MGVSTNVIWTHILHPLRYGVAVDTYVDMYVRYGVCTIVALAVDAQALRHEGWKLASLGGGNEPFEMMKIPPSRFVDRCG